MSLSMLIGPVTSLIDKLIPDKEAATQAKIKLVELDQSGQLEELRGAVSIINSEAQGESWLQPKLASIGYAMVRWFGGRTLARVYTRKSNRGANYRASWYS